MSRRSAVISTQVTLCDARHPPYSALDIYVFLLMWTEDAYDVNVN